MSQKAEEQAPYSPGRGAAKTLEDLIHVQKVELLIEIGNHELRTLECPYERIPAADAKGCYRQLWLSACGDSRRFLRARTPLGAAHR